MISSKQSLTRVSEWRADAIQEYFERNLGAKQLWNLLRFQAKWDHEQLSQILNSLIEDRTEVVEFMGGEEVVELLPPNICERMILVSALRLLVHKSGIDWVSVEERDGRYAAGTLEKHAPMPRKAVAVGSRK